MLIDAVLGEGICAGELTMSMEPLRPEWSVRAIAR